jgi:lipoyl(octanoyl) transferase
MNDSKHVLQQSGQRPEQCLEVKYRGLLEYETVWRAMKAFNATRTSATTDEVWILEHPPVYTVGIAGRSAHLPREDTHIPVLRVDRGGQITYHGPGQAIAYLLLDMKRRALSVRTLVRLMERTVIDLLADYGIEAAGNVAAPGVYVEKAKIAALGLRVSRGCCYHGLALNVDMDLSPFAAIDPCGYPGLAVAQLKDLGIHDDVHTVSRKLGRHLRRLLS